MSIKRMREARQARQFQHINHARQFRSTPIVLGVGLVAFVALCIAYFSEHINLSEDGRMALLFISQVLSGNWSPDFYKPTTYQGNLLFIAGTIIAILLNFGTIAAVIGTAANIFIVQRLRQMSIITALELRETAIIDELINELSPDQLETIYPIIETSIAQGKARWAKEILPGVFGDAAAQKFLNAVENARAKSTLNQGKPSPSAG